MRGIVHAECLPRLLRSIGNSYEGQDLSSFFPKRDDQISAPTLGERESRERERETEPVNFGVLRSSPPSIEELSREKALATDFLSILSFSSRRRVDRERLSRPAARFRSVRNTNYEEGQPTEPPR